jgi:hypothetical protein
MRRQLLENVPSVPDFPISFVPDFLVPDFPISPVSEFATICVRCSSPRPSASRSHAAISVFVGPVSPEGNPASNTVPSHRHKDTPSPLYMLARSLTSSLPLTRSEASENRGDE